MKNDLRVVLKAKAFRLHLNHAEIVNLAKRFLYQPVCC